jgi:class 3 adenylate cyclase
VDMPETRYSRTGEVARVAANADAGEILVTSTVRDLVAGAQGSGSETSESES